MERSEDHPPKYDPSDAHMPAHLPVTESEWLGILIEYAEHAIEGIKQSMADMSNAESSDIRAACAHACMIQWSNAMQLDKVPASILADLPQFPCVDEDRYYALNAQDRPGYAVGMLGRILEWWRFTTFVLEELTGRE